MRLKETRFQTIASAPCRRSTHLAAIRHGFIALEVERDSSSVTNTKNVMSCAKAIGATVLAIAVEESQKGKLPRRMTFDDPAFDYIPWFSFRHRRGE